jgi:hypothetical protein
MSQEKNNKHYPLIFVSLVIFLLLLLNFIPENLKIFGINLKKVDILSDIKRTKIDSAGNAPAVIKLNEDSITAAPKTKKEDYVPVTGKIFGELEDYSVKNNFLLALKQGLNKTQKIHIAYYGDSEIEGDLICQDFRESFQKDFGGKSVGFMAITSIDAPFRIQVKPSFSDDWQSYCLNVANPPDKPYGICGSVFNPIYNSWVKYEVSNTKYKFTEMNLFYTASKNYELQYNLNSGEDNTYTLNGGAGVHRVNINTEKDVNSIKLTFKDSIDLYGVNFENGNGIYVDNFPLRGHSGIALNKISNDKLEGFGKFIDYKLFVFQFGMNIVSVGETSYYWYVNKMINIINHFKSSFPEASFLIVSVGDKSTKINNAYVTDESVPYLVEFQRKIAQKTNSSFFNLYEAMGGKNSMPDWVRDGLAAKDYIHLSRSGAKKISKYIYDALMEELNKL